jgi:hypothetical protein
MIAFQAKISASLGIREMSPRFSLARSAIYRQLSWVVVRTSFFIRLVAVYISAEIIEENDESSLQRSEVALHWVALLR